MIRRATAWLRGQAVACGDRKRMGGDDGMSAPRQELAVAAGTDPNGFLPVRAPKRRCATQRHTANSYIIATDEAAVRLAQERNRSYPGWVRQTQFFALGRPVPCLRLSERM